ncbi:MAG: LemA family protein [Candidatus Berkelbacteria bacterium]|nr:LemA family protein [Candidatus Berkelbacteria bacterium]
MSALWIILIIVILAILITAGIFNRLVTLKNRSEEAWSDIDVQLKRRHDLIPNLVESVKGYAKHEKELFEKITEARSNAISSKSMEDKAKAENQITAALKSVFAVAENYPTLKANENFIELQREITDTEDKIQAARRFYNGNIRDLNIAIESFPSNIIAGMFKYQKKELFELTDAGERENIQVKF